ncbi:hypothetical protein Catovirus_1_955 [Catovirus CTV1]|uniref:Uncharacterized protein n=1 Tax=Catovirus CTV1 TaxID=1977631 RepID=A0A1V0SB19_9VIRU|nr:hypothetical protein Catovirus_1_955 [Catovirus CTV1]
MSLVENNVLSVSNKITLFVQKVCDIKSNYENNGYVSDELKKLLTFIEDFNDNRIVETIEPKFFGDGFNYDDVDDGDMYVASDIEINNDASSVSSSSSTASDCEKLISSDEDESTSDTDENYEQSYNRMLAVSKILLNRAIYNKMLKIEKTE